MESFAKQFVPEMIGYGIKQARQQKGFSQQDLANRLHCTRATVSRFENGLVEINCSTLFDIACALETSVVDLLQMRTGLKELKAENDLLKLDNTALKRVVKDLTEQIVDMKIKYFAKVEC